MSVQLPAPVFDCHCTVGAGVPVAATVNVTGWPAFFVCDCGWVVTAGAAVTDSVAALVFTTGVWPTIVLVNTARYCLPPSPEDTVKVYDRPVSAAMSVQLPPAALDC